MKRQSGSYFLAVLLICFSSNALSASLSSELLVSSCQEAVSIYSNEENQMNSYAALTTSLSEAFEGGYCAGVIQAYIELNDRTCIGADWYKAAMKLAKYSADQYKSKPIHELLSLTCE